MSPGRGAPGPYGVTGEQPGHLPRLAGGPLGVLSRRPAGGPVRAAAMAASLPAALAGRTMLSADRPGCEEFRWLIHGAYCAGEVMTEMAPATPPFGHRAQEQPGEAAWAQRTRLELGALPGAVPCARLHARLVLREWGLAGLDEAAELVVSELVTNAVQASAEHPGPAVGDDGTTGLPVVWLWLASDGRSQVAVEVGDGSPLPPVPDTAPHDVEGGRGLVLVETLSRDWGYYYPAEEDSHHDGQRKGVTKVVWALLAP